MQPREVSKPVFEPSCLATTIGSLPHTDVAHGTALMFKSTPEIPSWVQFPKLSKYENMMIQHLFKMGIEFIFLILSMISLSS